MKPSVAGSGHTDFSVFYNLLAVAAFCSLAAYFFFDEGHIGHPRPSKRKSTTSAMQTVQTALENYYLHFGEYPEPINPNETVEILPGQTCRIGPARCLYQALSGDGENAIKGIAQMGKPLSSSDGKISAEELKNVVVNDIPAAMIRKVGGSYILVDAFGRPFQYVKGDAGKKTTINASYDLWSYGEDDKNILATSKDTEGDPNRAAKWIKNW